MNMNSGALGGGLPMNITYKPPQDSLNYLKYDITRLIDESNHLDHKKFYRGYNVKMFVFNQGFYIIQTNLNDPKMIYERIPTNPLKHQRGYFKLRKIILVRLGVGPWRYSLGIEEPFVLDFSDESLEHFQDIYFLARI